MPAWVVFSSFLHPLLYFSKYYLGREGADFGKNHQEIVANILGLIAESSLAPRQLILLVLPAFAGPVVVSCMDDCNA